MGSVYLAEQNGPGGFRREVVLKLIRMYEDLGDEFRRLLLDEAQLTAWINHPNVVTVHDFGEQQGRLYIALARIFGINLLTLTQRMRPRRLPVGLAAGLIAQACDGLHAAHELVHAGVPLQVIHRDVSLSNLMIDTTGWVRVIDFGIARPDARHARHALTSPEMVRGNPAYMAPEQIMAAELDRTVDVYAAALIFYELCIGVHPFDRSLRRTALAPLRGVCGEIGPGLSEVVQASLALDPGARPAQISTLGAALWDFARRHGYGDPAHCVEFFRGAGVSLAPDPVRWAEIPAEPVQPHAPTELAEAVEAVEIEVEVVEEAAPAGPRRPPTVPIPAAPLRETRRPPPPMPRKVDPRAPLVVVGGDPVAPLRLADGGQVIVHTTQIRADERGPHPLALSRVPGLAPLPLTVAYVGDALSVQCVTSSGTGERIALYVDAKQPETRLERLLVGPGSPLQSIEVGHRRSVVRRLVCAVGRPAGGRWRVGLQPLGLEIEGPPEAVLMVVLIAREVARPGAPTTHHIERVSIHAPRR